MLSTIEGPMTGNQPQATDDLKVQIAALRERMAKLLAEDSPEPAPVEITIYTPNALFAFDHRGWKKVSFLEAERLRHPRFSEEELIRRAEECLALNRPSARRSSRPSGERYA